MPDRTNLVRKLGLSGFALLVLDLAFIGACYVTALVATVGNPLGAIALVVMLRLVW